MERPKMKICRTLRTQVRPKETLGRGIPHVCGTSTVREDFHEEIDDSQKACCARCCGAKAKKYKPIDMAVRFSLEHLDDKDRNKIITSAQIAALNTDYHMMVGKWWPDQMKQYGF
jgi:hypothetical protein